MGNCLVTKLKGVVDNPNLPKLGELMIKVTPRATPHPNGNLLTIEASSVVTLYSADGSNVFYVNGSDPSNLINTVSGGYIDIRILNTACTLMVTNKYAITKIHAYEGEKGFDLSSIAPCNALTMLDVTGNKAVIGDISVLKNCPLTNININGCTGITGKFADLPLSVITLSTSTIDGDIAELTCPNLTTLGLYGGSGYGNIDDIQQVSLEVLKMPGSKVGGNISGLSKYSSLRSLICSFNLEGSIESFVENACTLGRVSGNCNIYATSTYIAKVTSNGNPIPANNAVFITFTATGANVSGFGGDRTYNKSTGTWS